MLERLDEKNEMIMKLLHYFITQKNYSPIILQGVNNEIWLENMDSQYRIIRIVSNHIHIKSSADINKENISQDNETINANTNIEEDVEDKIDSFFKENLK